MADETLQINRRSMLASGGMAALGALYFGQSFKGLLAEPGTRAVPPAPVAPPIAPRASTPAPPPELAYPSVPAALLTKARAALDTHAARITRRDRIALVDFDASSAEPRLHLIDLEAGTARGLLVAHGSGSDPAHTGFLQRFSNVPGSNASSRGAFVTADPYVGKHGRSQRLRGLDPTNDNAFERAIVLHGAWYANADMLRTHGMLGRSQGCFAVGEAKLPEVLSFLGEGRLIYADQA
ncbi:murein L,D-transpeptidase catalytic domain family protein [Novosphingobium sp. 1949]|uniref:Murein L,D-transpeptidase catalytic domain family protein n=1 Tax=Novosphingobium organovorum TaxID=2930092 RepID=A0ABT0BC41_9SPHN|nr:murein L,D-transpeptidase catalytic domain family protein [Novosphingobium organovorum]MCJ2182558.1 murein L,D-transpeptidase catalytic domain family protein [Novosphingobium organovorum]